MMRRFGQQVVLALLAGVTGCAPTGQAPAGGAPAPAAARTLDLYFVDVEGGQSTLVVTPSGESLLIDAGFPGDGTFNSTPGDPKAARDAQRVLAAARAAGLKQIDHLMLTHYHADHAGGVMELAQLIPIKQFIDHAAPSEAAEKVVPGTRALYDAYVALRRSGTHLQPKPGDRLPLSGVEVTVVSSGGAVLTSPLPGAGQPNAACRGTGAPAQETTENPLSTGIRLQYGAFRFLDVGDLSGPPLFALSCPVDLLGPADVYLIAHHGGADGADPALYAAVAPRVAVFNNGPRKGAQAATLKTLQQFPAIDGWQLHRTTYPNAVNVADERIANLDESTSHWIKIAAEASGAFTVTNGRTGATKRYAR